MFSLYMDVSLYAIDICVSFKVTTDTKELEKDGWSWGEVGNLLRKGKIEYSMRKGKRRNWTRRIN